jgi:L-ascorbate metabolism protein UlaG (beta-lactamase superfamily)
MTPLSRALFTLLLALIVNTAAQAAPTTVTWYGHAAFQVTTPKGKVLMIDPWLGNPLNPAGKDKRDPLANITNVDYILISHAHFDHIGDAVALAKKTGARLVSNFELGTNMAKLLGYPKTQMGYDTLMNIGGEITIADGEVMVALTPAVHSSGMGDPNAGEHAPDVVYGGNPTGIVLKIKNGPTIYHTGDTAYFSDMKLIGEQYAPDLALINIGGHFGMEPDRAVQAAIAVRAKMVVPHHFGTFPVLTQDPASFAAGAEKAGIRSIILEPGGHITFEGSSLTRSSREER